MADSMTEQSRKRGYEEDAVETTEVKGKRRRLDRHVEQEAAEAQYEERPETKRETTFPPLETKAAAPPLAAAPSPETKTKPPSGRKRQAEDAMGALVATLAQLGLSKRRRLDETQEEESHEAVMDAFRDPPDYTIDLPRNAIFTSYSTGPKRLTMPLQERKLRMSAAQRAFSTSSADAIGKLPRGDVKSLVLDQRFMADLAQADALANVCAQFRNVEDVRLFATAAQPRPRLQSLFQLVHLRRVHLHMRGERSSELATGLLLDIARSPTLRLLRVLDVSEWCTLSSAQLDMLLEIFSEWPADNRPTVLSLSVVHSTDIWTRLFRSLPRLRVLRLQLSNSVSFDADAFGVLCAESKAVAPTLQDLQVRTETRVEQKDVLLDAAQLTHLSRLRTLLVNRDFDSKSVHGRLLPALYQLEHLDIGIGGAVGDELLTGSSVPLLRSLTLASSEETLVSEEKLIPWIRRHPRMTRLPRGCIDRRLTTSKVVGAMVKAWRNLEAIYLQLPFETSTSLAFELIRQQQRAALTELVIDAPDNVLFSDKLLDRMLGIDGAGLSEQVDESWALQVLELTGMVGEWTALLRPLSRRCGRLRRLSLTVKRVFAHTPVISVTLLLASVLELCPDLDSCVLDGPFDTGTAAEWKSFLDWHDRRPRPVRLTVHSRTATVATAETKAMDTTADESKSTKPAITPQTVTVTIGLASGADPNVEYMRSLRNVKWIGSL